MSLSVLYQLQGRQDKWRVTDLLCWVDGDLSEEQERQIKFIREACGELLEMVNDL